MATFRINYYYGALNPFGYHLVNVLLHSTVCWLVVVLSYTFFQAHFPSLVAGLLFAVHPIHTGKIALHASINFKLKYTNFCTGYDCTVN